VASEGEGKRAGVYEEVEVEIVADVLGYLS
jgi:hypothetical protein